MNSPQPMLYSIDETSRDIGIGKDTLRVWERRYGFPCPQRDAHDQRRYPLDQVMRLRLISRLLDRGFRPGKVVTLGEAQLEQLAELEQIAPPQAAQPQVRALIDLALNRQVDDLEAELQHLFQQLGPMGFVIKIAAPLLTLTGQAWSAGQLSIYGEHLITQQLERLLQQASLEIPRCDEGPRVLLTTLPGERHGMGLLMAGLMLRMAGARTINLGVETPMDELVLACESLSLDAVALSFSAVQKRAMMRSALRELNQKLPQALPILVGGAGTRQLRNLPKRITRIRELEGIEQALHSLNTSRI